MGLAERRVSAEFQVDQYPALLARIHQAAGFALPVTVDWDSLAIEGESRLYAECWPQVYFEPLIDALRHVGRDDMGTEAMRDGLNSVTIQNKADVSFADGWATFEGGVLTLDHNPITNAYDVKARADRLVLLLESRL